MQIEENRLSSSIFAGCSPWEIVKEVASDFADTVGGVVAHIARGTVRWLKDAAGGIVKGISNAISWARGLVTKGAQAVSGAIAWVGGKSGRSAIIEQILNTY